MNGHRRWSPADAREPLKRDADLLSLVNGEVDLQRLFTAVLPSGDMHGLSVWGIAAVLERTDRAPVVPPARPAAGDHGPLVMLLVERDQLDRRVAEHLDHGIPASSRAGGVADSFVRSGEVWTLTFDGETVQLRDAKGFRDIAELLRSPGREVHCLELMGSPINESDLGWSSTVRHVARTSAARENCRPSSTTRRLCTTWRGPTACVTSSRC